MINQELLTNQVVRTKFVLLDDDGSKVHGGNEDSTSGNPDGD